MTLCPLLVLALLIVSTAPAAAADPTSVLLHRLDSCDRSSARLSLDLDVLLALADGRSARELASVLEGPRPCIGYVTTYGDGPDELVFVGGVATIGSMGALLWVDDGWWRIASVPIGYVSGTREVRRRGDTRELFAAIGSGGSAGAIGVVGIRLTGARATLTMRFLPGAEIRDLVRIDDDHMFVSGRLTGDRLFTWGSHPMWPYGAEWLFERRDDAFVAVAQRQSRDPYWLMTGLLGALFARDEAVMRRFATNGAVASALALPTLTQRIDGLQLWAERDFLQNEHLSWSALPASVRTTAPAGPVWGSFRNYDDQTRTVQEVRLRFDRDGEGWTITAVERVGPDSGDEPALVP